MRRNFILDWDPEASKWDQAPTISPEAIVAKLLGETSVLPSYQPGEQVKICRERLGVLRTYAGSVNYAVQTVLAGAKDSWDPEDGIDSPTWLHVKLLWLDLPEAIRRRARARNTQETTFKLAA